MQATTFEEALILMEPLVRGPLRHVGGFAKRVGVAELNVTVALVRLGHRTGRAPLATTSLDSRYWLSCVGRRPRRFLGGDPESVERARGEMRAETIVVYGASGAFAVDGSGVTREGACPVETIDTAGAGEAFVAGFLSGRLRSWDAGEDLRLANACGACAVTVPGDVEGMPTEEEAMSLLHDDTGWEGVLTPSEVMLAGRLGAEAVQSATAAAKRD